MLTGNVNTRETTAQAWAVAPQKATEADIRDVVMIARNVGYVSKLERAAFKDDMYAHQRELKAAYRNAYKIEMCLGQAAMIGVKWGIAK